MVTGEGALDEEGESGRFKFEWGGGSRDDRRDGGDECCSRENKYLVCLKHFKKLKRN